MLESLKRADAKPKRKEPSKPNRKYFTEDNVLTIRAKRKQYLIWDAASGRGKSDAARGLAILVSPTGTKSYRCVYYYPASPKPYYMHLGRVGEMSLQEARRRCRDARDAATHGEDPTANAPTHSDNFKDAVDAYIKHEQIGKRENKSANETGAVMLSSCAEWHSRPVATIRYGEIDSLLQTIRDGDTDKNLKPRPYLANRVFSHLKDFFGWCVRSKRITTSPMSDMERPWEGEKPRDRNWFKGEAADKAIKALWSAADEIGGLEGRYLKVMILTGKRKTALSKMRWEQITADWFWDAPPSDVENKRLHGVPLATLTQRILHPRKSTGLVFGEINLDRLQGRIRKASGISDFIYHGLRHVIETKTATLRDERRRSLILPHVRDLLYDHKPLRGTGGNYEHNDIYDYIPEMEAGAEIWAKHVDHLVTPQGAVRAR